MAHKIIEGVRTYSNSDSMKYEYFTDKETEIHKEERNKLPKETHMVKLELKLIKYCLLTHRKAYNLPLSSLG